MEERFSGAEVSLLALYGNEDESGGDELLGKINFRRKFRRGFKKIRRGAKSAAKFTPHYWAGKGALAVAKKTQSAYMASRKRRGKIAGEDERFSGSADDFEIQYINGEDDRLGFLGFKRKKKKKTAKPATVTRAQPKKKKKKFKFLPGLKKVGKYTSKITTGAAKIIGVPQPILNALAKVDPTKGRKASASKAIIALQKPAVEPGKEIVPVQASMFNLNPKMVMIAGGLGLGAIVLSRLVSKAPKQSYYSR